MPSYTLSTRQWLPRPREEVFRFFSDARNLQRITPELLHFHVLTPGPIEMGRGALIDYRLKLRGVPLRWRSSKRIFEFRHRALEQIFDARSQARSGEITFA